MKESYLYGIIGLLLGIVIAWFFATNAVNSQNMGVMRMMGMRDSAFMRERFGKPNSEMSHAMEDMMIGLENRTGDEFDKAFLSEMIEHHEGAINMATEALSDAKHQEIKDMAKAIIDAQTKEVEQMKQWQKTWYNQ